MQAEEIKQLVAFHARHDTSEKVVCCEWCHKQVPVSYAGLVPVEIDPDTGMATDEINVCYDCLPPHDELVIDEDDGDDEVRKLAANPAQNTALELVRCGWCFQQVPKSYADLVPHDPMADDGTPVDQIHVCFECLPEPDELAVDEKEQRSMAKEKTASDLTVEEQQFLDDMGNDDGFWRYPAYSSPVSASDLLQKVKEQFESVPSYVERFKDGREPVE
jgi:hypothetical protein